jgi:lysozyme family protein
MYKNKTKCINWVLEDEGGYVDHPKDPGGATNMGITLGTLSIWRKRVVTKMDVRKLTRNEAIEIYDRLYWIPSGADHLPSGLDYWAFDIAVNSGVGRVNKLLVTTSPSITENIEATRKKREAYYRSLKTFAFFGKGWLNRNKKVYDRSLTLLVAPTPVPVPVEPPKPSKDGNALEGLKKPVEAIPVPPVLPQPPAPQSLWERAKNAITGLFSGRR